MSQRPQTSMDGHGRNPADRAGTSCPTETRVAEPTAADAALEAFWLQVRRGLLSVCVLWLLTVPILLWVRRMQGELTQPPTWPVAVLFGLALIGAAALWRCLAVADGDDAPATSSHAGRWWDAIFRTLETPALALAVPTPLLLATAAALTFSGGGVIGVVLLWVLVAAEETAAWCRQVGQVAASQTVPTAATLEVVTSTAEPEAAHHAPHGVASSNGAPHDRSANDHHGWDSAQPQLPEKTIGGWPQNDAVEEAEQDAEPAAFSPLAAAENEPFLAEVEALYDEAEGILPADVQQQWTRSRLPDGSEQILATLRAELAAGQRTASIHLAFCPPLAEVPELEFEQVDGPDARIQQGELFRHGARLDVRLAEPAATACSVVIELAALAAASTEQAR